MEPFIITVGKGQNQMELNVHPQQTGRYQIICHGALIGEVLVSEDRKSWKAITADQLQPGGFPVYEYDETSGHQDMLLDDALVQEIGRQIINVGLG